MCPLSAVGVGDLAAIGRHDEAWADDSTDGSSPQHISHGLSHYDPPKSSVPRSLAGNDHGQGRSSPGGMSEKQDPILVEDEEEGEKEEEEEEEVETAEDDHQKEPASFGVEFDLNFQAPKDQKPEEQVDDEVLSPPLTAVRAPLDTPFTQPGSPHQSDRRQRARARGGEGPSKASQSSTRGESHVHFAETVQGSDRDACGRTPDAMPGTISGTAPNDANLWNSMGTQTGALAPCAVTYTCCASCVMQGQPTVGQPGAPILDRAVSQSGQCYGPDFSRIMPTFAGQGPVTIPHSSMGETPQTLPPLPPAPQAFQSLHYPSGPGIHTSPPAHIPPNLFRKLAAEPWAYQSLSRWTPVALAEISRCPPCATADTVYLGYSHLDLGLSFAEWSKATGELLGAMILLNGSVAAAFDHHFSAIRSRYVPIFWPQLRMYDIKVRLSLSRNPINDLLHFHTRVFAALLMENCEHPINNESGALPGPNPPSGLPLLPGNRMNSHSNQREPIGLPPNIGVARPPGTTAYHQPLHEQQTGLSTYTSYLPPQALPDIAVDTSGPAMMANGASAAWAPQPYQPGNMHSITGPNTGAASAHCTACTPTPNQQAMCCSQKPPLETDLLANFLDNVYSGSGSRQVVDALAKTGVAAPAQLIELAYLGGTALDDLFQCAFEDSAVTPFQQIALAQGLKKKFGVAAHSPASGRGVGP